MLLTATPRAAQAALSTQSVPVAATATSFSTGRRSSVAAVIGALLVMAIDAPARRSTTWSARVSACSISSCANDGGRTRICGAIVARSRKTMRWLMLGRSLLGGEQAPRLGDDGLGRDAEVSV